MFFRAELELRYSGRIFLVFIFQSLIKSLFILLLLLLLFALLCLVLWIRVVQYGSRFGLFNIVCLVRGWFICMPSSCFKKKSTSIFVCLSFQVIFYFNLILSHYSRSGSFSQHNCKSKQIMFILGILYLATIAKIKINILGTLFNFNQNIIFDQIVDNCQQ